MKKIFTILISLLILSGCLNPATPEISTEANNENPIAEDQTDRLDPTTDEGQEHIIDVYFSSLGAAGMNFTDALNREKYLHAAYDTLYKPAYDFAEFKKIQQEIPYTFAFKTEKISKNTWQIKTEEFYKDETASMFENVYEIIDGKIKTVSSKELPKEQTVETLSLDNNTNAFIKWTSGTYTVVLEKNGQSTLIDTISPHKEFFAGNGMFSGLTKTTSSNYFLYGTSGWEYGGFNLVDIAQAKKMLTLDNSEIAEFSKDDKYFVACSPGGMGGDILVVYDLPSFAFSKLSPNPETRPAVSECNSFNRETGVLKYKYYDKADFAIVHDGELVLQ